MNNEAKLLYMALSFEEGHPRRTQHILKVYALAKMLGEIEGLGSEEQAILNAAAILHDIPIKLCKEHYAGDACQENQKKEAPALVNKFLNEANYEQNYLSPILELVQKHHDYGFEKSKLLQLLMEADLIVNCYEYPPSQERIVELRSIFVTSAGNNLLNLCVANKGIHTTHLDKNFLIDNLDKLRTTDLGKERIRKNVVVNIDDPVEWCKSIISNSGALVEIKGKNYYVDSQDYIITINRSNLCIITVKRKIN